MNIKLECKNLTKKYNHKDKKLVVLDNVNYKFEAGKLYVIKGQSGSGKSTLIQILGLILNYDSGDVLIDNENINNMSDKEKSLIRNKKIGFIFQSYYLNPLLKAYENVILPLNINCKFSYKSKKILSYKILEQLGLNERQHHFPYELSGGEQQRVAIARAIVNNPEIILADEPTGSLDPKNSKIIFEFLKKYSNNGKCVIVVSHSDDIDKYADEIVYINNKKLINKKNEVGL